MKLFETRNGKKCYSSLKLQRLKTFVDFIESLIDKIAVSSTLFFVIFDSSFVNRFKPKVEDSKDLRLIL